MVQRLYVAIISVYTQSVKKICLLWGNYKKCKGGEGDEGGEWVDGVGGWGQTPARGLTPSTTFHYHLWLISQALSSTISVRNIETEFL